MKFLDTCVLLEQQQDILQSNFLISNITLTELESIKTSSHKDEEIKWKARKVLHLLEENPECFEVVLYDANKDDAIIQKFGLLPNNDSKIIASAYRYYKEEKEDIVFVTLDLACKAVAMSISLPIFNINTKQEEQYTGYKELIMDDTELAYFYGIVLNNNDNVYELKNNEYLLIKNEDGKVIDSYKWFIDKYVNIPYCKAESRMFGKIIPKDNDSYQHIALDSLKSNQITMLRGPAGSGKSLLSLAYLMQELEKGNISTIVIFTNTVAVRGAAKLGFYPGDKNQKLLDSQIGNFLVSKLGSIIEVERMIDDGTLILVPIADCRGFDTSGMNAGILVTEAQNTSIDIMKLLLQRIGEDSIVVIEGDDEAQVDMKEYSGKNNGMKRLSEVFRGHKFYGEIKLQSIHRSKIANIAELM